jgi:hypothetical protein
MKYFDVMFTIDITTTQTCICAKYTPITCLRGHSRLARAYSRVLKHTRRIRSLWRSKSVTCCPIYAITEFYATQYRDRNLVFPTREVGTASAHSNMKNFGFIAVLPFVFHFVFHFHFQIWE